MPNLPYTSSTWATHNQVGQTRIEYPFPNVSDIILTRTFQGPSTSYAALDLNTPDVDVMVAYLVETGPIENVDGGDVRYTRVFATIPSERDEWESYAYRFPGYTDVREPVSLTVASRIRYNYYLCATGQTYETPEEIPLTSPQTFSAEYLNADTTPSKTTYEGWVTAETRITVESTLRRWKGNIYERAERTIIAQ